MITNDGTFLQGAAVPFPSALSQYAAARLNQQLLQKAVAPSTWSTTRPATLVRAPVPATGVTFTPPPPIVMPVPSPAQVQEPIASTRSRPSVINPAVNWSTIVKKIESAQVKAAAAALGVRPQDLPTPASTKPSWVPSSAPASSSMPAAVPSPGGTLPLTTASMLPAAMQKPSFWLGTAAFAGLIGFLAVTNGGPKKRKRRR